MYYVYKTTNIVNNKIYVGVHKSDNIQSDEYLGSGKVLNVSIAKYGRQKFNRQILYQFQTKEEAYAMERLIVDKQFVKRKDTYNIKLGGQGGFGHMQGSVYVKDKQGDVLCVLKDDPRYLSKQLVGVTAGTIVVKDQNGNTMRVSLDDPRYKSGQLKHITKGLIVVKDKEGKTLYVSIDDPRYLSGQLVHNTKGMISVKDKEGNTFKVHKTDPRWLSGQLVGVAKGNILQGHQLGQKNSQYGTIWVTNGKQNKKIKKDNNIPQGWRRGRKLK